MNKWRPEGWKRPHRFVRTPSLRELVVAQDTDEVKFYQNESYELGADAMLEALKTEGIKMNKGWFQVPSDVYKRLVGASGTIVFIPDEE